MGYPAAFSARSAIPNSALGERAASAGIGPGSCVGPRARSRSKASFVPDSSRDFSRAGEGLRCVNDNRHPHNRRPCRRQPLGDLRPISLTGAADVLHCTGVISSTRGTVQFLWSPTLEPDRRFDLADQGGCHQGFGGNPAKRNDRDQDAALGLDLQVADDAGLIEEPLCWSA